MFAQKLPPKKKSTMSFKMDFFYSLPLYFGKVSRQTSEVNRAATSLFSRSIKTLTFEWFYKKKDEKKNSFFVVRK